MEVGAREEETAAEEEEVGPRGPRGRLDSAGERAREKWDGERPRATGGERGRRSGCGMSSGEGSRKAVFSIVGVLFRTRRGLVDANPGVAVDEDDSIEVVVGLAMARGRLGSSRSANFGEEKKDQFSERRRTR